MASSTAPSLVALGAVLLIPLATAQGGVQFVSLHADGGYGPETCATPQIQPCHVGHDAGGADGISDDSFLVGGNLTYVGASVAPGGTPLVGPALAPVSPSSHEVAVLRGARLYHPVFAAYEGVPKFQTPILTAEIDGNATTVRGPLSEPLGVTYGTDEDLLGYDWVAVPWFVGTGSSDDGLRAFESCEGASWDYCEAIGLSTVAAHAADALPSVSVGAGVDAIGARMGAGTAPPVAVGDAVSVHAMDTHAAASSDGMTPQTLTLSEPIQRAPATPARAQPLTGRTAETAMGQRAADTVEPGHGPAPLRAVAAGVLSLALAALYQRLLGQDLLLNPKRRALVDLVRARPGVSLVEAGAHIGTDHRGADHHVRKLERSGLLIARRGPQRVELYLPGRAPPQVGVAEAAVVHPLARRLLLEIARRGGATRRELREILAQPRQTVEWHVRRLVEAGVLAEESRGPVRLVPERREAVLDVVLGFEKALKPSAPAAAAPG